MDIKNYVLPDGYLSSELAQKTKYKSIKTAYEKNDLSIIVPRCGSAWYAEVCPARIFPTVKREMKRLYPDMFYLYDFKKEE